MKFPQDTTQNKVASTLLPTLTNPAADGLATQSKRGFAENLRHQISVVAQASRQVLNAEKQDFSRQHDVRPEKNQRGTDLPANEQKLPRDRSENSARQASAGKDAKADATKSQSQSDERAPVSSGRNSTASADSSRPGTVLTRPNTTEADVAGTVTNNLPDSGAALAADQTETVESGPAFYGQILEHDKSADTNPVVAPRSVEESSWLDVAFPATTGSGESADSFDNPVWTDAVPTFAESGSDAVDVEPVFLFAAGTDLPLSPSAAAFLAPAAESPSIFSARSLATDANPFAENAEGSDAPSLFFRQATSPLAVAIELAHVGLQQTGMPTSPAQNQLMQQPTLPQILVPQSGQQPAPSESALASGLLSGLLQAEVGADAGAEGSETGFADKLLNQKPTLPMSLQYGSMLSQSAQQLNTSADAPLASGLAQGVASAQLALSGALDTASVSGSPAAAGASSSSAPGSTSSGLSAALYSQEQRQQAAAEARNVQAQSSRALDTSLSTTSALKLPGLDVTFGQAGWADRIGRQMLLQSAQGSSSAQIRLDPPELGSLTVKIQLVDQTAAVNFVSPHAMVRDALEQQAGRLQEMFSEQGIDLLDVSVSDQSSHSDGGEQGDSKGSGAGSSTWIAEESSTQAQVVRQSESLIDFYA